MHLAHSVLNLMEMAELLNLMEMAELAICLR